MPISIAEAFAPATVANIGVGFDILGLAVREPGDIVRAEKRAEPGAVIVDIQGDGGKLSRAADRNTACIGANAVLKMIGATEGVSLTLLKGLPLASGLGSSAASAVAGAMAVNHLFGDPLRREELLPAALEGEAAVSGYHADNVAPSLFGGITLVTGVTADSISQLPIPDGIFLALITPNVAVPTAMARSVLPKEVSLKAMIAQTAGVARLVDALHRSDIEAMAAAMETDTIVEPARAHLMPYMMEVRQAAKAAGGLCLVISGAGPTLLSICADAATAERVREAMAEVYANAGMEAVARVTQIAASGATARMLTL